MRTIKASEFKAKCLALMAEVAQSGEPLLITKRGRLVAQLSSIRRARGSIWGLHKGQIEILGDILQPIELD
jgi:prevent-host-death family protein